MRNKLLIGIVVILSIGVIILINVKKKDYYSIIKKNVNYGELYRVSYSCSGDKAGRIYEINYSLDSNVIEKKQKEFYRDPLKISEYRVKDDDFQRLKDYINKYNLPLWENIQTKNDVVLDGLTCGLSFSFKKNKKIDYYDLSFDIILPKEGQRVLDEFIELYQSLLKEENKIDEYEEG